MIMGSEKLSSRRKACPSGTLSPQILHGLLWDQTRFTHSTYSHSTNCESFHSVILPLLCCYTCLTPTTFVCNILQASQPLYVIACNEYEIRLRATSANGTTIRLTPRSYTAS